jgi:hypothetical protein
VKNLQLLDLTQNKITGNKDNFKCTDLIILTPLPLLHFFSLPGTIPDSIGSLTSLQHLELAENQLSGTIPATFSNLVNLTYLSLGSALVAVNVLTRLTYSVYTHTPRTTHHAPRTTHHAPRTTHHAPRTTHHAPRTTHHAPRTTHHAPRTTHHAPRTTHHAPRTTHHAPRTTHHTIPTHYPSQITDSLTQNKPPGQRHYHQWR